MMLPKSEYERLIDKRKDIPKEAHPENSQSGRRMVASLGENGEVRYTVSPTEAWRTTDDVPTVSIATDNQTCEECGCACRHVAEEDDIQTCCDCAGDVDTDDWCQPCRDTHPDAYADRLADD